MQRQKKIRRVKKVRSVKAKVEIVVVSAIVAVFALAGVYMVMPGQEYQLASQESYEHPSWSKSEFYQKFYERVIELKQEEQESEESSVMDIQSQASSAVLTGDIQNQINELQTDSKYNTSHYSKMLRTQEYNGVTYAYESQSSGAWSSYKPSQSTMTSAGFFVTHQQLW